MTDGPTRFQPSDRSDEAAPKTDERQGLPSTVAVSTESTPFFPDATKREDPKGRYVKYTGVGTVRQMTPSMWKEAHVDSDNSFEWNFLNHKQLPLSIFTDAELQYLLRVDGRFEIVEAEKASETTE